MRYFKNILVLFFLISLISCRKDQINGIINNGVTTPYSLDYPQILEDYLPPMIIPSDNPMTVEGVELGRQLFYDNILSADNTQACASCHAPSTSFTDTARFSTGIDGLVGDRNSMAIINLGWGDKFFWDGRAVSLEDQAFGPVVNPIEMHNTWPNAVIALQATLNYPQLFQDAFGTSEIDSTLVSKALSQFERTLMSGSSPHDLYLLGLPNGYTEMQNIRMLQGRDIFMDENAGDCFHCHGDIYNPLWTDNLFHNNGLDASITDFGLGKVTGNPNDNGKFKTPTLRNLSYTAPYMHDGRFKNLDEVIEHYSTGLVWSSTIDDLMKEVDFGGAQFTLEQKDLLKAFLISLNDESFLTNPAFQEP